MLHQTFACADQAAAPILQVTGLQGGPADHPLFDQLDLFLGAGVCALIGDEGTGKTSLLRLLSGDLQPTAGEVRLLDQSSSLKLPRPAAVFWADLRLPQNDLDTPKECWAAMRLHLPAWSEAMQNDLIEALQMAPHLNKRLNMLSTGSRRKVGLVAALSSGATVTLLDQPFVSLDQASIAVLKSFLNEAAHHPGRAWVVADYEVPSGMTFTSQLQL
jgi:ABC-type multidrug transport system ATPase subunit